MCPHSSHSFHHLLFSLDWFSVHGRTGCGLVALGIRQFAVWYLELLREFLDYCQSRKVAPLNVVRAFIGDLCALTSQFERPREDGYASSGSDARELARAYFQCSFALVEDPGVREKKAKPVQRRRKQVDQKTPPAAPPKDLCKN